ELLALDGLRAAARAAPGLDGLAAEVMLDERLRARSVPANLGIDRGNAGIEHRVAKREEQFYVVVELVAALLGGKLRELRPEAGWLLGSRFQRPVLGGRLLHIAELGADADDLFAKLLCLGIRAGHGRRNRGTEFPRHVEREWLHLGEMRRAEIAHLHLALRVDRRWRLEAARLGQRVRRIGGAPARPIGIIALAQISELVGAVGMACIEHMTSREIADADGS